jgi:hypothetical protein
VCWKNDLEEYSLIELHGIAHTHPTAEPACDSAHQIESQTGSGAIPYKFIPQANEAAENPPSQFVRYSTAIIFDLDHHTATIVRM